MNAIPPRPPNPTQAAAREDNLAACLELRDIGLQLARAAAARALAAHEHAITPEPATPQPAAHPAPKPADPDLAFARHARSVRQSVELWEKITAHAFARPQRQSPPDTRADPASLLDSLNLEDLDTGREEPRPYSIADSANLYEAVANLALKHPDHLEIPENLEEIIDEILTAFPDDHLSANFARICLVFEIPPDRFLLLPHLESQLRPPDHYQPHLE